MILKDKRGVGNLFTDKRGLNQIDWIISLVLFLMFIVFTFVVVSPHDNVSLDEKASLNNIQYSFTKDYTSSLSQIPVFIETQRSGIEPIILTVGYPLSNFIFDDQTPYSVIDNEIIFNANISDDITQKNIISSDDIENKTYDINNMYLNFENNKTEVASKHFFVDYQGGSLEDIYYRDIQRMSNIKITDSNDNKITFTNKKINNQSTAVVLKNSNNFFVFKDYLFYDLSRTYLSFNTISNFIFSFDLYNYNGFDYSGLSGNYLLNETSCLNVTTDYFEFTNNNDIVTFRFEPPAEISTCTLGTNYISVKIFNPEQTEIFFSNDTPGTDYNSTGVVNVYLGLPVDKQGVTMDRLNAISNKTVSQIRTDYAIEQKMNFELMMSEINYTTIYDYSYTLPGIDSNVFIKSWDDYLLYPNGTSRLVLMSAKVWQ